MCPCMGPKGPGLIKKYPAVAGYFRKREALFGHLFQLKAFVRERDREVVCADN
jgi:hypothetical protein